MNSLNWLAQQENLIAIRPREPEDRRLTLTADQQQRIMLLCLFILPGLVFAIGRLHLVAEKVTPCAASLPRFCSSSCSPGSAATSTSSTRSGRAASLSGEAAKEKVYSVETDKIDEIKITAGGETSAAQEV